jgi:hypothetical protein
MLKKIFKIFGILMALEAILFVAVVVTSMTDEKPSAAGIYFYWTLKYILGFPLVLINSQFPFFLESHEFRISAIFMTTLNNLILALMISQFLKIFPRKQPH